MINGYYLNGHDYNVDLYCEPALFCMLNLFLLKVMV